MRWGPNHGCYILVGQNGLYILVGQTPVPCDDLMEWVHWFEAADRQVRITEVGPWVVSTVFLAVDHRFLGKGPPLLFETMIFSNGESLNYQTRCATWLEAELEHEQAIAHVRKPFHKVKQTYPPSLEQAVKNP